MGIDKRGRNGAVIDRLLIVIFSLLFITPALLPTSSTALTPDEDFSIEIFEKPFFNNITDITHSEDGVVYVGTDSNGLVIYDGNNDSFTVLNADNSNVHNFISKMNRNTGGLYYIRGYDSYVVIPDPLFKLSNDTAISIASSRTLFNRFPHTFVLNETHAFLNSMFNYSILAVNLKDSQIEYEVPLPLCVGTDHTQIKDMSFKNGYLYQVGHNPPRIGLGGAEKSFIHKIDLSNKTVLDWNGLLEGDNSFVSSVEPSSWENKIFVGSEQGILIIESENLSITGNFTRKDGLISDEILDLEYSDSRNTLFASSKEGLSVIDLNTGNITNIDLSHGLLSNSINSIDWNEERSELYIGHDTGISILRFDSNPGIPEIHHTPVTEASVGEKIMINATITGAPIESAYVCYRPLEQANYTCVEMQADGNIYTAEIPALPTPGTMQYYISATDIYGNENSTDIYEIEVSRQDEVTQENAGWIPGMSMNMSIIVLVMLIVAASVCAVMLRERMKKAVEEE